MKGLGFAGIVQRFAAKPLMALVRDELFGPVAAVLRTENEDEALRLANATGYGLAASIFTRDLGRALRFSRALRAGVAFVNAALETYAEWTTTYRAPPGTVLEPVASEQLAP